MFVSFVISASVIPLRSRAVFNARQNSWREWVGRPSQFTASGRESWRGPLARSNCAANRTTGSQAVRQSGRQAIRPFRPSGRQAIQAVRARDLCRNFYLFLH
jgi:hypothetical protein